MIRSRSARGSSIISRDYPINPMSIYALLRAMLLCNGYVQSYLDYNTLSK